VKASDSVVDGLCSFYDAFNSGSVDRFAAVLARSEGTSVIGSAPGEGHFSRESWVKAYASLVEPTGLRLRPGASARGFASGGFGFVIDEPVFELPNGNRLPTRLTGVLTESEGRWQVVHLHFSVGVPDEDVLQRPS
jgi:hypothetical protein